MLEWIDIEATTTTQEPHLKSRAIYDLKLTPSYPDLSTAIQTLWAQSGFLGLQERKGIAGRR